MFKKICILCALLQLFCVSNVFAEESYFDAVIRLSSEYTDKNFFSMLVYQIDNSNVKNGDEEISMTASAKLYEGTTIVPAADLLKYFGAEFEENADEFIIKQGNMTLKTKINDKVISASFEGDDVYKQIEAPVPVMKIDDVVYVPLRSVLENFFAGTVQWNDPTKEIFILRNFQTKRLIVSVIGDRKIVDDIDCKEKITDNNGIWVLQFDMSTPDCVVKDVCDKLNADTANVKYAEPDVLAFAS